MAENRVVPEALDDTSYDIWSNCMKIYLLSQDLWDVVEPDLEETETEESSKKKWGRKNALALHAIHMSCGSAPLSRIGKLDSAKEAWDLLKSIAVSDHHDSDTDVVGEDDHDTVAKQQSDDSSSDEEEPLETILEEQSSQTEDYVDYKPFWEATKQGEWKVMKEFIDSHSEAIVSSVGSSRTALHYILNLGNVKIGGLLVDETKRDEDLQIQDHDTYTAFSRLSNHNHPGVLKLLQHMFSRNNNLPNIGNIYTIPVIKASWKGFKDTTRYLYSVTDKEILNPDSGGFGVELLVNCINIRLFDIASEIVRKFPKVLLQKNSDEINPIYALAKSFSALKNGNRHKKSRLFELIHWMSKPWKYSEHVQRLLGEEVSDGEKLVYNKARVFLRMVCEEVSSFSVTMLEDFVYDGMIEASKNGVVEFVTEMLVANSNLIEAHVQNKTIFWHAVENRQAKVHNLIYSFVGRKDSLFSCQNPEKNNILHLVAQLAPPAVLDRSSGPALQMQKELQWFQEVWSLAKLRYREDLNNDNLTPRALFTKAHAKLIDDGEKAMKDTAQSSTVVGALIITVMFAAAFTVPGGNNQDSGLPVFLRTTLFRIFIVCDALSLYSSTTSVLMFLGILTSRYAEQDFSIRLPRKLMMGLTALFFSITTMMISFCTALALMLDRQLRYVLPTVLLSSVPIIIFMSSIVPVLSEMFMSTFGPSIFDKTGKAMEKKEDKKVIALPSSDDTEKLPIKEEDREEAYDDYQTDFDKKAAKREVSESTMIKPLSEIDTNVSSEMEEERVLKEDPDIVLYNPTSVDEIV